MHIAKDFVGTGMCLFLDSSSTVQQLIPSLIKIPNLVIITNSLKTASLLSESNNESLKVFIVGGEIKMNTNSVIPSNQDPIFDSFRYDLAFFSCRGMDEEGIYEANFSQANLKKEMMQRAKQKILLVDDSKFDSSHFFKIGNYSDYDAIITNQEPRAIYPKLIETLTTNYAELNPEINSENENLNNSDTVEPSTSSIQEDNKPVDGNINLFDSM